MTYMTIEQFRQIHEDWKQSGLSVQQYCENTGLTESRFYYWKSKLKAESLPSACGSFIPVKMSGKSTVYSARNTSGKAMKRDVQDGEAFIFVNRALTSMKILHAEYGGLVIYNLKLEKGCISLPDMQLDDDDSPPHRLTRWQELVLMTQGINPLEVKRSPRWLPQKSRKEKIG